MGQLSPRTVMMLEKVVRLLKGVLNELEYWLKEEKCNA
jgi:hypothetical protein